MVAKSFLEILTEQIRSDLREEIKAEVKAEMEAKTMADQAGGQSRPQPSKVVGLETWLLSHVEKSFFNKERVGARKAYQKATPPPAAKVNSEPLPKTIPCRRAKSLEELCAVELITRVAGDCLPEAFSEADLKVAWRRAALKTHPDRFSQSDMATQAEMNALFNEITEAFDRLEMLFDQAA